MLAIRQAQLEVLGQHQQAAFEARLTAVFAQNYPRESLQAGGPEGLSRWVHQCVQAAMSAGYRSQRQCGRWLLLSMMLGAGFATDPQLPWVATQLADVDTDPDDRLDGVLDDALAHLGATAGEQGQRVVRAMLRIRDFDFATVPPLAGPEALADACSRMQALYPELFQQMGPELGARCVEGHLRAAALHGLGPGPGAFLYALLCLMLGHGFAQDALHPWAAEALNAQQPLSAGARADLLERLARAHMAQSLAVA
jgi:hypothetical protein